jgi:hypothetical protein
MVRSKQLAFRAVADWAVFQMNAIDNWCPACRAPVSGG